PRTAGSSAIPLVSSRSPKEMDEARRLRPDWHPGTIPENVVSDPSAYLGTSYSFVRFRSEEPVGLRIGRAASLCDLTILDVGPRGRVVIGDYALVNGAMIICDSEVTIGDYTLIGWDVVLMDTYRVPFDVTLRRRALEHAALERPRRLAADVPSHPIRIARNVWIGFEAWRPPGPLVYAEPLYGRPPAPEPASDARRRGRDPHPRPPEGAERPRCGHAPRAGARHPRAQARRRRARAGGHRGGRQGLLGGRRH